MMMAEGEAKNTVRVFAFPPDELMRETMQGMMRVQLQVCMLMSMVVWMESDQGGKATAVSFTCLFFGIATMALQFILTLLLSRKPALVPGLALRLTWMVGAICSIFVLAYLPVVAVMGPRQPGYLECAAAGFAIVGNLAFAFLNILLLWIWLIDVVYAVCACCRRKKAHR